MSTEGGEKISAKSGQKIPGNGNWGANMLDRTQNIPLSDIISQLSKAQRERLISGYDLRSFARIFEDDETMATVDGLFRNGLNVSATARALYMHRNTLIYRLNKIQSLTGLDLKNFDMAVTFEILRSLYELK